MVLHADDLADLSPVRDLRRRDVAKPDMAHQTLPLQFGQCGERRFERAFDRALDVEHAAQVDDVEHVEAEVAQIVVHRLRQFFRRHRRDPRAVVAAPRADLGDDDEIVAIRMQRLADDLVGDVRAVKVAGVDVVDALGHGLAQNADGGVTILRGAEHAGSSELHGAVAETVNIAVAEGVSAELLDAGHVVLLV